MSNVACFKVIGPFFKEGELVTSIQLYHYEPGTTRAKDVYADNNFSTTSSQPIEADGNGVVTFYGQGYHKFVVEDSAGRLLHSWDHVLVGDIRKTAEFAANKSAADQTISTETFTKVTFDVEQFDADGTFADNEWTPGVIGKALVIANLEYGSALAGSLYKTFFAINSVARYEGAVGPGGNATNTHGQAVAAIIDIETTTDKVSVQAWHNEGADSDINLGANVTYFMGSMLS